MEFTAERHPASPKPTATSPDQETAAVAIRVFRMVKGLILLGPLLTPPCKDDLQGNVGLLIHTEPSRVDASANAAGLNPPARAQFPLFVRESPDMQKGWDLHENGSWRLTLRGQLLVQAANESPGKQCRLRWPVPKPILIGLQPIGILPGFAIPGNTVIA